MPRRLYAERTDQFAFVISKHKQKNHPQGMIFLFLVALIGIEPILLSEHDFESSASTSSATEPEH